MKTKQKIVRAAIDLFSKKGFTETSVREIAATVGVNESSLYNHFDSKSAILQHILEYYRQAVNTYQAPQTALARLTRDATPDDMMACLILYFPPEEEPYFLKTLQVLFQEQFRNEAVRAYVANEIILRNEQFVSYLIRKLVAAGALDEATDVDFWAKLYVSLHYKFSARQVMGIGEAHKKFNGKGNVAMKKHLYETLFSLHGTKKNQTGKEDNTMLEHYFSNTEIAEELSIPLDAIPDLLDDKMTLNKSDVDRLISKMAAKLHLSKKKEDE